MKGRRNKMSKNKKNIAKNTIKVLSDSKVKIKKGKKMDLTPFISFSVNNCRMGTIDGSGKAGRPPKDLEIGINNLMLSSAESLRIMSVGLSEAEFTIVDIVRLKDSNTFDMTSPDTKGEMLRSSTLGGCYKEVKMKWKELNSTEYSKNTNYLYFPELISFMNSDTGDVLRMPFKFNYLMISVPSISRAGYDDVNVYINNVVADVMDAIIDVRAKNVIVDPFSIKVFRENPDITSSLFNTIVSTDKVKNYLDSVTFAIPNSDNFVTFLANQKIAGEKSSSFTRIKVTKEDDNEPEHIFDVKKEDNDVEIVETNVKKDGTLDIGSIVDANDDDE